LVLFIRTVVGHCGGFGGGGSFALCANSAPFSTIHSPLPKKKP